MTKEQEQQIRFNIFVNSKDKTVQDMEAIFQWVVGNTPPNPPNSIIPVSSFKVVKS